MSDIYEGLKAQKNKETKIVNENTLIKEGETLLLHSHNEDLTILHELGLDHHILCENEIKQDISKSDTIQELYKRESFRGTQIKELCKTYSLKMLHLHKYNGPVPDTLAAVIRDFEKVNKDIKLKQNNLFILAPMEQFKKVSKVKNMTINMMLFYREDNSYSSYLVNAEESDIFSNIHSFGEDFSFLRKYKILFNNKEKAPIPLLFFIFYLVCTAISMLIALTDSVWATFIFMIVATVFLIVPAGTNPIDKLWNEEKV